MGRPSEGWKVKWKRGWAYVHFTWNKHAYRLALGTRDRREAQTSAAREYAEVVSGRRRPLARAPGKLLDLAELLSAWLESKRTSIDPDFFPTLETYGRLYVERFGSLDRITEASTSTFGLVRLGECLRTTVLRELSYLRQFLAWCELHGALPMAPRVPGLPPKAKGVRTGPQRAKPVHVSDLEARAILELLPERSKTIAGRKWPLRSRFAFAWETALRPETISRLRVPDNWRPGMRHLELTDEDDKARFGREVDLTPEAVTILENVAPERGVIFGHHVFYKALKRAAALVLGPARGKDFAPYDFRHGRAKERLDAGALIRGVSYMLGHKRVSTTDKYLAPDRSAGREAIRISAPKAHPTTRRRKGGRRSDGKEG